MENKSPTPQFYSENRKALHDWMTDKSCAYCDGVSSVGYFADPKVVKCLSCGLFRFFPRISPEGVQIAMEIRQKKTSLISPIFNISHSSS